MYGKFEKETWVQEHGALILGSFLMWGWAFWKIYSMLKTIEKERLDLAKGCTSYEFLKFWELMHGLHGNDLEKFNISQSLAPMKNVSLEVEAYTWFTQNDL